MIRIVFIIRSLETGGAERQLFELVRGLDKTIFSISILVFYPGGELTSELEDIEGVKIICMGKNGRWDLLTFLPRLISTVHSLHPHIVHGYLDVPNILSLLAGRFCGAKIIFGVRNSFINFSNYDWTLKITYRLANLLSPYSDKIIVNSYAGLDFHKSQGLSTRKAVVIPNGIDTAWYMPDRLASESIRQAWNIKPGELLVGTVGRIDPQKGLPTFIAAAKDIKATHPNVRFVCVGSGSHDYWQILKDQAASLDVEILWVGKRKDMAAVYNAFDVLVLASSYGEGFPNVVGEAMACEIPCVITDIGDSARIVNQTGIVIHPHDHHALAEGVNTLLRMTLAERQMLGKVARERIIEKFSSQNLIRATTNVFIDLTRKMA
jgi:glycosyltransferase involved in cell wall biosynthesis